MSNEPTLYQPKWSPPDDGTRYVQGEYEAWMEFRALVEAGHLVPVVRCVHGLNGRHIVRSETIDEAQRGNGIPGYVYCDGPDTQSSREN